MREEIAALWRRSLFLILSISLGQCCAQSAAQLNIVQSQAKEIEKYLEHGNISGLCDYSGFKYMGNLLQECKTPFVVRSIKGRIRPEYFDSWPDPVRPIFQLRAMEKGDRIFRAYGNKDGFFRMAYIPEGRYCFFICCDGFDDSVGIVFVNKHADPKNEIFVKMKILH